MCRRNPVVAAVSRLPGGRRRIKTCCTLRRRHHTIIGRRRRRDLAMMMVVMVMEWGNSSSSRSRPSLSRMIVVMSLSPPVITPHHFRMNSLCVVQTFMLMPTSTQRHILPVATHWNILHPPDGIDQALRILEVLVISWLLLLLLRLLLVATSS